MMLESVRQALGNVDVSRVQLSSVRYDGNEAITFPKFQERTFAYEFYHQLRRLQDNGMGELKGLTLQAEVSKVYQGIDFIPDLIVHIPSQSNNQAVFEFKLATNFDIEWDLYKLQILKHDLRYTEAFMIVIGTRSEIVAWISRAHAFRGADGEEVRVVGFDPSGETPIPIEEVFRVKIRQRPNR